VNKLALALGWHIYAVGHANQLKKAGYVSSTGWISVSVSWIVCSLATLLRPFQLFPLPHPNPCFAYPAVTIQHGLE
jgi:hypothetical protein